MDAIVYLGIDVSKTTLDAAIHQPASRRPPHKKFKNSQQEVQTILAWVGKMAGCEPTALRVVMENTGVYGVAAASALHAAGCEVIICNGRRARAYATAIGQLNKTDKCDAIALAAYGTQPNLFTWEPLSPELGELNWVLKRLSRSTEDLKREDLRAQSAEIGVAPPTVMQSLARSREFHLAERRILLETIEALFNRNPQLCADRELLLTIPWVGPLTASHLVCILRSRRFQSPRQVVSLLGLAPIHASSGTSVVRRPRVPRSGNPIVRGMLYMAVLHSLKAPEVREMYDRLRGRGLVPQQALVAIMRKTVHIAFGVLKHRRPYCADWQQHREPGATSGVENGNPNATISLSAPEPVQTVPPAVVNSVMCATFRGVPKLFRRARRWPDRVKKTQSDPAAPA
jgi:transposase